MQSPEFAQKVWCVIQRTGGGRYLKKPSHILESAYRHQFSPFIMDCYFIDFDGRRYVPVYGRFEIRPYDGSRALVSLPVFPLRIARDNGLVDQEALISRGRESVSYPSISHRYYDGWTHSKTPSGRRPVPEREERFDSDVMIDIVRPLEHEPAWRPPEMKPDLYEMDHRGLGDTSQDIDQD